MKKKKKPKYYKTNACVRLFQYYSVQKKFERENKIHTYTENEKSCAAKLTCARTYVYWLCVAVIYKT